MNIEREMGIILFYRKIKTIFKRKIINYFIVHIEFQVDDSL